MRIWLSALSACTVLALVGCGSSTTCSVDTDCPGVEVCIGGHCVERPADGGMDGAADAGDGAGPDGDGPGRPAALLFTFETGSNEASSASYRLASDGLCFGEPPFPLTGRRYALVDSFIW
ncbi:MAG: hypothetical protein GYA21_06880 [Myxococcales bacterium]|nr:hypothetical protein [Myxococcales bacterium]